MYSAMARRRTETNMQQLMCEVERLNVFRLLVEVRHNLSIRVPYRTLQSTTATIDPIIPSSLI